LVHFSRCSNPFTATISLVGAKRALTLQLEPDIGKRYRIHNYPLSWSLKNPYLERILVSPTLSLAPPRGQMVRVTPHPSPITRVLLSPVFDPHAAVATALRRTIASLRLAMSPFAFKFRNWTCTELFRSLVRLCFTVTFPPEYPDVCPTMSLEGLEDEEGALTEQEEEKILRGLEEAVREHWPYLLTAALTIFQGNENLGMAMTFTLITHVREQLSTVLQDRVKKKNEEEAEKERKTLEVGVIPAAHFQGLTDSIP
jgi:hypothetical protein